jgi:hypothetical protein
MPWQGDADFGLDVGNEAALATFAAMAAVEACAVCRITRDAFGEVVLITEEHVACLA